MSLRDEIYDNIITAFVNSPVYNNLTGNASSINTHANQSIKTKTKGLIMQFPLLISDRISYETAKDLADGFERENAILAKMLIMNDLGDISKNANNTSDVLNKIHTNINNNPTMNALFESRKSIIEENLKQNILIEDKFNNFSLNNATLPKYLNEADISLHKTTTRTAKNEEGEDVEERETLTVSTVNKFIEKSDFEKINKLQPTFVSMQICRTNRENTLQQVPILFGVKCVVHPLKSEDIIANIQSSFKNTTLFKLVRWTTGEYSLAQGIGEVVFDYNRMKTLGTQAGKENNFWWYKLKKLKTGNASRKLIGRKDVATKTATIIISADEVDLLNNKYRVDIKDTKVAKHIIDDLFLLNFGYVDESTEMVYVFDETTFTYHVKKIDDFRSKSKDKAISVDDIKSLFGR